MRNKRTQAASNYLYCLPKKADLISGLLRMGGLGHSNSPACAT
ncbi:hypothetical protein [Hymenobacter wooponensis]|nr:hypothetical protein [Hymenobacter wooponensis]